MILLRSSSRFVSLGKKSRNVRTSWNNFWRSQRTGIIHSRHHFSEPSHPFQIFNTIQIIPSTPLLSRHQRVKTKPTSCCPMGSYSPPVVVSQPPSTPSTCAFPHARLPFVISRGIFGSRRFPSNCPVRAMTWLLLLVLWCRHGYNALCASVHPSRRDEPCWSFWCF